MAYNGFAAWRCLGALHKVSSLQKGLLPPNIAKPLLCAGRIISTKFNLKQ